jgi:hypothetical protein
MLDGMDQAKTYLPRFSIMPKMIVKGDQMKMKGTGVLLSGRGELSASMFTCNEGLSSDANLVFEALLRGLNRLPVIPRKLCLQADNCWRESKNRYIFAAFAKVVDVGLLDKVRWPANTLAYESPIC